MYVKMMDNEIIPNIGFSFEKYQATEYLAAFPS